MEDFGAFWTFQENVDDLKQKLQNAKYELEITRNESNEKIKKSNEHTQKLLQLLQAVCKERDYAKAQLKQFQQILAFNKPLKCCDQLIVSSATFPAAPFSPDSPLLSNFAMKTNSGVTESNNFSLNTINNDTNNNNNNFLQSQLSPMVDSLSDNTQSATSLNSDNILLHRNSSATAATIDTTATKGVVDQVTLIIDSMAKGRPRPQQGQLLQAVIEAGPLLQTLIMAGSLPQWRNPPGLVTWQIPPVNIKGCESAGLMTNNGFGAEGFCDTNIYGQINGGSMGICPSSMLDFGSSASRSCLVGERMVPSALSFDCQLSKRQRIL